MKDEKGREQLWLRAPVARGARPGLARLIARVELAVGIQRLPELGGKSLQGDGLGLSFLQCNLSVCSMRDLREHWGPGFSQLG